MKRFKEVKAIKIINIALVIFVTVCAMLLLNMKESKYFVSSIPEEEIKVSKRYDSVISGDERTESPYVTFDAFFLKDLDGDGNADAIRGTCNEVGKADTLYFELRVLDDGYLKNGKITIDAQNFYFGTTLVKDEVVKNNYISKNTKQIELKNVQNGTQKLFTGIVRSGNYSKSSEVTAAIGNDTTKYSKVNKITLSGIHVSDTGVETPINKEIEYNVDWYGKTVATILTKNISKSVSDFSSLLNDQTLKLSFDVQTAETANQLILKENVLTGTIPSLDGFMPTEVTISGTGITYTYNEETGEFSIKKEAIINESGEITTKAYTGQYNGNRNNTYTFDITYPLEAYDILSNKSLTLKIPMETYYEGYNNQNPEFNNPYVSNIAKATVVVTWYEYVPIGTIEIPKAEVTIGKYLGAPYDRYYISKEKSLKIYNEISDSEANDYYTVRWYAYTGGYEFPSILIKEDEIGKSENIDTFIKNNSQEESTEDVASTVGIYFSDPTNLLGAEGWIKVYDDETNELLMTFTKDNWNEYNQSTPYMYENPVKRVRVETSHANKSSRIYIYHVKEIDDDSIIEKYTREQFDELEHIKTNMNVYFEGYGSTYNRVATAWYAAPWSVATIELLQDQISTQETCENEIITIKTQSSNFMEQKWKNGKFLIKMPSEIIDMSINSVTINNNEVTVANTSLYEENGNYYLRIDTKNEEPAIYTISVNCNITADPRMTTKTKEIEMYAKNEDGVDYYKKAQDIYDVDMNENTEENVHKSTINLSLNSPSNLLTHQIAKNYDEIGSITIAPQIAKVEKSQRTANVEITVTNNYTNKVTNVLVQGVIPFEGNKYILGNGSLGSSFSTTMSNSGVTAPAELANYATVYYSTQEKPTNDITDVANNWVIAENVVDWSKIKTFIIDLGEYKLNYKESITFSYEINIPEGLEYNEISYSEHGVYFDLETNEGLYSTSTAVSKLGFMIARKYDLKIEKYQVNTDKKLSGVTFIITEEGKENETIKKLTDSNGNLIVKGLLAERKYKIQETGTTEDYEVNNEKIEFYTYVDENNNLILKYYNSSTEQYQDLTDKYSWVKTAIVTKEEGQDYQVQIALENEVKAGLKITKYERGEETKLSNVQYRIRGEGFSTSGKTIETDTNGEIELKGLKIGAEYTLEEIKAKGYYLASPMVFKIVNNNGIYEIQVKNNNNEFETIGINGGLNVKSAEVTSEDSLPIINLELEDDKIPTYNLEIIKTNKVTNVTAQNENEQNVEETVYLEGAKFRLYKGAEKIGDYTTDENGKITIENLYQFESERNINQTYTLKEIEAPEGYAIGEAIKFKVEEVTEEVVPQEGLEPIQVTSLKFIEELKEGQIAKNYTVEGNKVILTVEDVPIFKLIKKDDETDEPLANTKFAIYDIENGEKPATDAKGKIIGAKEIINGKEYYTLTTNNNGEITANLKEGLYKAVEVQADEKYDLTNQTYYFGVGISRESKIIPVEEFSTEVNNEPITLVKTTDGGLIYGNNFYGTIQIGVNTWTSMLDNGIIIKYNSQGEMEWGKKVAEDGSFTINTIIETSEKDILVVGHFYGTVNIENQTFTSVYGTSLIIKYNSQGNLEFIEKVGDNNNIKTIAEIPNGGFVVGGTFLGNTQLGEYTLTGTGEYGDGVVVKYNSNREVNWAERIVGGDIRKITPTSDGGMVVAGIFNSSIIQIGDYTLTSAGEYGAIVIKYDSQGNIDWVDNMNGNSGETFLIVETQDEGLAVKIAFSGTIQIGDYTLASSGNYGDSVIIKYNNQGEIEWVQKLENTYIISMAKTQEGDIKVGGNFKDTIQIEDNILTSTTRNCGIIVKYSKEGKVENIERMSGSVFDVNENEIIEYMNMGHHIITKYRYKEVPTVNTNWAEKIGGPNGDNITSMIKTKDEGFIVGGSFREIIQIGEYTLSSTDTYNSGMVIKYDSKEKVEWVRQENFNILSIVETQDGGLAIGGYYEGTIQIGDYTLTSAGDDKDGIIVKYNRQGEIEWIEEVKSSESSKINSIIETEDGGIGIGGEYEGTIQVGNYTFTCDGRKLL